MCITSLDNAHLIIIRNPRDRKRKKFVGESGKEGQKRVKTESGTWIAASYKSNAYLLYNLLALSNMYLRLRPLPV